MGKQKPPPAPDYAAAAVAQGQANLTAANQTAALNRPNQVDPNGTQTWSMRPGADPNNPQAGDWTVTNALSPVQQALKDKEDRLSSQYGDLAQASLNTIGNTMGTAFNPNVGDAQTVNDSGLPELSTAPNANPGRYMAGPARGGMVSDPQQSAYYNPYGAEQRMNAAAPQYYMDGFGELDRMGSPEALGRAQTTAPMGGMVNTGESGQYAPGVPQGRASLSADGLRDFGSVEGSSEQSRQRVTDAMYQRQTAMLDPRTQQDTSDLTSRLAAQGITEGSAAYNRAVDNQKRQQNDAYAAARNDAIMAGGAEESRIIGDNLGVGRFQNDTRGQEFGERERVAGFNNNNLDTTFAQGMASAGFNNSVKRDNFDRGMAVTSANNATVNGQYDRELNRLNFNNNAGTTDYSQRMSQAQFNNTATKDTYNQRMAGTGFNNDANNTNFAQGMAQAGFNRDSQRSEAGFDRGLTDQYNSRFDKNYDQRLQTAGFNNDVQDRFYEQQGAQTGFNNQVDEQNFNTGMARMTANNGARAQGINERTTTAGFNNTVRGNAYAEALQRRQLPMNEANALRMGNQVGDYAFQQYGGAGTVGAAPVYQAVGDRYTADVGNVNARNATTANRWNGITRIGSAFLGGGG